MALVKIEVELTPGQCNSYAQFLAGVNYDQSQQKSYSSRSKELDDLLRAGHRIREALALQGFDPR